LGAVVDDFVVTERAMSFGAVLIGSFTLKMRYHEGEKVTRSASRARNGTRHPDLMLAHLSAPKENPSQS